LNYLRGCWNCFQIGFWHLILFPWKFFMLFTCNAVLHIEGLSIYSRLHNLALFVPVLPEILTRLLFSLSMWSLLLFQH
jgi:hypothetical protein